jgi:hypothetical protein
MKNIVLVAFLFMFSSAHSAAFSQLAITQNSPSYFGETTLTDAQKRKAHLPYVKTATNCFANIIRNDPTLLAAIQNNQLLNLVAKNANMCSAPVGQLISEHDKLYGLGTGKIFFEGPYLSDLTRALLARLQPDITRQKAKQTQLAEEYQQRIDVADKTVDLLKTRMYECTGQETAKLVKSSETADVLTTAAMTICNREIEQAATSVLNVLKLKVNLNSSEEISYKNEIREIFRKSILTQSVQIKALSASNQQSTNTNVSSNTQAQYKEPLQNTEMSEISTCLRGVSKARDGQLIDQEILLKVMLDLCRTEIEGTARKAFINNKDLKPEGIALERERVLADTIKEARSILGMSVK